MLEAENLEEFYRALKERSEFCVTVKETGYKQRSIAIRSKRARLKDLTIFCRQFSTMLSSGITVIKCLDILYQQTANKRMKATILGVYEAVQKGEALSAAMQAQKGVFPPLMIHMIEAGETGGSLDTVMQRLADNFEKDLKVKNKVNQALIYPIFLSIVSVLVVIFLLAFIMPNFIRMFRQMGGSLPVTTRILIATSNFLTDFWYIPIAAIVLLIFLWNTYINSPGGRLFWDRFKLKMPVFGKLFLTVQSSRFCRTLASLFSSGVPIIQSLEIVGRVIGNRFLEQSLAAVAEDVKKGLSMSSSMRKLGIFPPMLCSMISIGEESGNMDEILNKTAAFYDEESDAAIQKLISLIEPIMIVFLALIIGFIMISIITPIYSLYNQINARGGMF